MALCEACHDAKNPKLIKTNFRSIHQLQFQGRFFISLEITLFQLVLNSMKRQDQKVSSRAFVIFVIFNIHQFFPFPIESSANLWFKNDRKRRRKKCFEHALARRRSVTESFNCEARDFEEFVRVVVESGMSCIKR